MYFLQAKGRDQYRICKDVAKASDVRASLISKNAKDLTKYALQLFPPGFCWPTGQLESLGKELINLDIELNKSVS